MFVIWEWFWFAAGLVTLSLSLLSRRDGSWRDSLFGLSMVVSALIFRFAPAAAIPGATGMWRTIALVLAASGFAVAKPSYLTGPFTADRALGREFGWACLAMVVLSVPEGLLGPRAGWWVLLPAPACLWIIVIVPRWLRRVYRRGQTRAVAWAGVAWAAFCAGFFALHLFDPALVAGFLAVLTAAGVLFIRLPANMATPHAAS